MKKEEPITKIEALVELHNQLLARLTGVEIDLEVWKRKQVLSVSIPPDLTQNIIKLEDQIAYFKLAMVVISDMMSAEKKKINEKEVLSN